MRVSAVLPLALGLSACAQQPALSPPASAFWTGLQALCGSAFEGKMVEGTAPSDQDFAGKSLVMHVRSCAPDEVRVPFHVGENRSRTWIITRLPDGYRLKHDHRHADGSEEKVTQYGGDTRSLDPGRAQDFHSDAYTAKLLPAAATNIWTMEVNPGRSFRYTLRRDAEKRRFTVEFDLTLPLPPPPAPWGHE